MAGGPPFQLRIFPSRNRLGAPLFSEAAAHFVVCSCGGKGWEM